MDARVVDWRVIGHTDDGVSESTCCCCNQTKRSSHSDALPILDNVLEHVTGEVDVANQGRSHHFTSSRAFNGFVEVFLDFCIAHDDVVVADLTLFVRTLFGSHLRLFSDRSKTFQDHEKSFLLRVLWYACVPRGQSGATGNVPAPKHPSPASEHPPPSIRLQQAVSCTYPLTPILTHIPHDS